MDIQLFSSGKYVNQAAFNSFLDLEVTPKFLCILEDSIRNGKIDPNVVLEFYSQNLQTEQDLYAFCLCLREGADSSKITELNGEEEYIRLARLCLDKNDEKLVSILMNEGDAKINENDAQIAITCRATKNMENFPTPKLAFGIDYLLVFQAARDCENRSFCYYVSRGYFPSYPLVCELIEEINHEEPVTSKETKLMLLACAEYGVPFDLYQCDELKKRDEVFYEEFLKRYTKSYYEKIKKLIDFKGIPPRLENISNELHLDTSSFRSLMRDLEYLLELEEFEFEEKQKREIKKKFSLPGKIVKVHHACRFDILRDYRVFWKEGNEIKMITSEEYTAELRKKIPKDRKIEILKKMNRIHSRYEDTMSPKTYANLFDDVYGLEQISNLETDSLMRKFVESNGRRASDSDLDGIFPYVIENKHMGYGSLYRMKAS